MNCDKREVRIQLALFASANFLLGLGVFMFLLCSNSAVHREHLAQLFTDPGGLFSPQHSVPHEH